MINLTRPRNSVLAIHRQIEVTWLALVISFFPVAVESQSARAQAFQTKYSFSGKLDGGWPETGLTLDAHANLYGTAPFGGGHRRGVRFKVTQSGAETVLHSFGGKPGDGSSPDAGLVRDGHGNLYGSTNYGGSDRCLHGCGTVFRLDKTGKETVLYGFGAAGDGSYPTAGLLRDEKGDLYGTTSVGGTYNSGTIFKVDMNGQEIVLYSFTGIEGDGASPNGGLVRDSKGNLFGTTRFGGDLSCTTFGCGTVFRLDKAGRETVLHTFTGIAGDGYYPSGLVRDEQGNLYGTTFFGGTYNQGTVFKLDTTGEEFILYSFTANHGDGANPDAGLVCDSTGNLFGTTVYGGHRRGREYGSGTVFKLDTKGRVTVLHRFNGEDGANPSAVLVQDANGNLYGTTYYGGTFGYGTVFKLKSK